MSKTLTSSDLKRLHIGDPLSLRPNTEVAVAEAADRLRLNLIIVPSSAAADFSDFCRSNSKACPIVAVARPGEVFLKRLGACDLRSGTGGYDIHSFGSLIGHERRIDALWRKDFVGFVLGSASVMDIVLARDGISVRKPWSNTAPRYRTRFGAVRSGSFGGDLIVSMRAVNHRHVDRLRSICARYPGAHGSPVHVGDPAEIGISALARPDWGLPVQLGPGEVPVFFASSMTAHVAAATAELPLTITSSPGRMLVTGLGSNAVDAVAA